MGLQRVGHDWATSLSHYNFKVYCSLLNFALCFLMILSFTAQGNFNQLSGLDMNKIILFEYPEVRVGKNFTDYKAEASSLIVKGYQHFLYLEYSRSPRWSPNPGFNQLLSELHRKNQAPEEEVGLLLVTRRCWNMASCHLAGWGSVNSTVQCLQGATGSLLRGLQGMKGSERGILSHVRLFATPWTVAYQAPLSMGFSRQ